MILLFLPIAYESFTVCTTLCIMLHSTIPRCWSLGKSQSLDVLWKTFIQISQNATTVVRPVTPSRTAPIPHAISWWYNAQPVQRKWWELAVPAAKISSPFQKRNKRSSALESVQNIEPFEDPPKHVKQSADINPHRWPAFPEGTRCFFSIPGIRSFAKDSF